MTSARRPQPAARAADRPAARDRLGGAGLLVLAVLGSWCLAAVAAWLGLAPSTGSTVASADPLGDSGGGRHVVLVGVPGLTWDLVDEERTPTLAGMADEGGAAALVLRGEREVTCAPDAWLTVGAGQRAGTDLAACVEESAEPASLEGVVSDSGVERGRWRAWQDAAAARPLGPEPGTLARLAEQAGTCVVAHGQEAVLGAARPDGSAVVAPPAGRGALLPAGTSGAAGDACRIHLVSAPALRDDGPVDQLRALDGAVEDLRQRFPAGTTILVAGMGQTSGDAQAQVLVAAPAQGQAGAWLTSGTTRQAGLVQLTDLPSTLLELAGIATDDPSLAGQPVAALSHDGDHVADVRDLAAGTSAAKQQAPTVLVALLAVFLPLLALALLHGRVQRRRSSRRSLPLTSLVGTAALATPASAFLVGLVPWWRTGSPAPTAVVVILLGSVLVTALAWAGPWRRHPLGPPAVAAGVTAVVLGVDVVWSARLGLVSVLGLQPVTAGRFYGQGNVGFGVLLGAVLVIMAAVLSWARSRRLAAVTVLVLGLGATVLTAAPGAGADFGGVPALVAATGLVTLTALGLRWTALSLLAVAVAALVVGAAAMVLDWLRGPQARTHLGGFVQSVLDGEAAGVVARKLDQSLGILVDYPVSWFAVLALVGVAAVALRRPHWSTPLWHLPGMPSLILTALVAMVLAWLLNDSGIAAMSLTLAMLIAAAVAVLGRSRTAP